MNRRNFLAGAILLCAPGARATESGYTAYVILRRADCPACRAELAALLAVQAEYGGLSVVGLTADPPAAAALAARQTGADVRSDRARIRSLGLLDEASGEGKPAVVLVDRCGSEVGRVVGRAPGRLATPAVVELWRRAPSRVCASPKQT